jgi:hypothetical protein
LVLSHTPGGGDQVPGELSATQQHCEIPLFARGLRLSRQTHPNAGSRRVFPRDQLTTANDGLDIYHPGQKATLLTPALRARILSAARRKPSDGSTYCSCRKLAMALGVSKDAVHRSEKKVD